MDLKSLSISDLKAIIDYCGGERFPLRLSEMGHTSEWTEDKKVRLAEYERIRSEAESELSLRLGIKP